LVNLFGDVPLVTTTNYKISALIPRTSKPKCYEFIIKDLVGARDSLESDFAEGNSERIRANKWAATALLARAYLYTNDWKNAEWSVSVVPSL